MKKKYLHVQFFFIVWAVVLGASFFLHGDAGAHRVNIFAWVEGDTVWVECKYPDGREVHEGVIRVLDSAGKELLNGKTNTQGEFSFKVPQQDDVTIVLEAGMGHRADWPLSRQDHAPAGEAPKPEPAAPSQPAPKTEAPPSAAKEPAPGAASLPPAGIDQAIEKALDKKLAPVLRMLAEMHEQKVRLTDILGGVGYIIGLVGVAAYFKRKPL
jgi:nickel transport protein